MNTLDSAYGCAAYLSPMYKYENVVNVVRFRYGRKVWLMAEKEELGKSVNGAPKVYGEKYYLTDVSANKTYQRKGECYEVYQKSIFDKKKDEYLELEGKTAKGRVLTIKLWRWNNLLIRSQDGENMKDKPFDLVASQVVNSKTGQLVFNRTMFTTVNGQRKDEISTQQAFEAYRDRYDIEPSIKFSKQKLLLGKYQTPDVQHFDNWLVVVMAAFWLLFAARKEVTYKAKKWQQYKTVNKKAVEDPLAILTPSQTRQAAQGLFLTFDPTPFLPKTSNKGIGRKKDTQLTQRIRHPVVKKMVNMTKIKLTTEKIE